MKCLGHLYSDIMDDKWLSTEHIGLGHAAIHVDKNGKEQGILMVRFVVTGVMAG